MADEEPKSAIELAMERLRRQDAEQGIVEHPLTDEQKARIEEARRTCRAQLAQLEIMHQAKLSATVDPEACATLETQYRRDVERATEERDRAIEKIRCGK